jgi:DNA-3-methyladenine glycosylase II
MSSRPDYYEITEASIEEGIAALSAIDVDLAAIHARRGFPPMWVREPGFATLFLIILEQQVSIKSAKTLYDKIAVYLEHVTPETVLVQGVDGLRGLGITRQKSAYIVALARDMVDGRFDLDALAQMDDESAYRRLVALHGIGAWSANIYLLMALRRRDILPLGDLALDLTVQRVKDLPAKPTPAEFIALAEPWRPWRAVACRLLWAEYLGVRNERRKVDSRLPPP